MGIHVCMYVSACIYGLMDVGMHVCVCVYIYIYICVCVCVCVIGCIGMLGELVHSPTKVAMYPAYAIHCKRL